MSDASPNRYERWLANQVRQIIEAEERADPVDTGQEAIEALPAFDADELEPGHYVTPATEVKRWTSR